MCVCVVKCGGSKRCNVMPWQTNRKRSAVNDGKKRVYSIEAVRSRYCLCMSVRECYVKHNGNNDDFLHRLMLYWLLRINDERTVIFAMHLQAHTHTHIHIVIRGLSRSHVFRSPFLSINATQLAHGKKTPQQAKYHWLRAAQYE